MQKGGCWRWDAGWDLGPRCLCTWGSGFPEPPPSLAGLAEGNKNSRNSSSSREMAQLPRVTPQATLGLRVGWRQPRWPGEKLCLSLLVLHSAPGKRQPVASSPCFWENVTSICCVYFLIKPNFSLHWFTGVVPVTSWSPTSRSAPQLSSYSISPPYWQDRVSS